MTTIYSMADELPRSAAGAKFFALTNTATSQLDFALTAGLGPITLGTKIVAAQQIGTHVAGSRIEPTGGVGVAIMGHFASAASSTGVQNAVHIRSDDRGQLYHSGLAVATCAYTSTSHDTVLTSSGIVMKIFAAACGAVAGAQVRIMNGATSIAHLSFNQANDTITLDLGPGACFASLVTEKFGTVGPIYLTTVHKQYGN